LLEYKLFCLLPGFDTNAYLVWNAHTCEALLIDPASPSEEILSFINEKKLNVLAIVNTHGHADHIGGNAYFKKVLNAMVCIHKSDAEMLINPKLNLSSYLDLDLSFPAADRLLSDGDTFKLGQDEFIVIHTPGHSRGSICLYSEKILFSGDTLFNHDVGRTDLPGGSYEMIINSITTRLFTLPDDTLVLPGHGPQSIISDEKKNNPYK